MGAPGTTPGPWTLGKQRKFRVGIDGKEWTDLAKVVVRMDGHVDGIAIDSPDGRANAHQIAASPDLYDACKWAESALAPFSKEPAERSGIAMLRAALAKARGEA